MRDVGSTGHRWLKIFLQVLSLASEHAQKKESCMNIGLRASMVGVMNINHIDDDGGRWSQRWLVEQKSKLFRLKMMRERIRCMSREGQNPSPSHWICLFIIDPVSLSLNLSPYHRLIYQQMHILRGEVFVHQSLVIARISPHHLQGGGA